MLKLFVHFVGEDHTFPVFISSSETVGDLKRVIVLENTNDFKDVDACRLMLYRRWLQARLGNILRVAWFSNLWRRMPGAIRRCLYLDVCCIYVVLENCTYCDFVRPRMSTVNSNVRKAPLHPSRVHSTVANYGLFTDLVTFPQLENGYRAIWYKFFSL
jgi:hypothetical protein